MTDTEQAAWSAFEAGIVEDAAREIEHLQLQVMHLHTYIKASEGYMTDYLRDLRAFQEIAGEAYQQLEERYG